MASFAVGEELYNATKTSAVACDDITNPNPRRDQPVQRRGR
jgi:hypothetical protein